MGLKAKLIGVTVIGVAIFVALHLKGEKVLPEYLRSDHYWGPKPWKLGDVVPKDDPTINKFTIKVDEVVLTDLKSRLNNSRLPSSLQGINFEYGFNCDYLKEVIDYWGNKYDWRKEEATLNKFPQFTTQIEGINVHYYHIKPSVKAIRSYPMVMVHGWPSSIIEFQKIIPLLTADTDLNFELIIPSLPGYGWSEASHKPGLSVVHVARIVSKLMTRLGHDRFFYQGGDWGMTIGRSMVIMFPERVMGFHNTMPTGKMTAKSMVKLAIGSVCPKCVYDNPEIDVPKLHPLMDTFYSVISATGFMHLQATRPDTVGAALNDSPAGLAAWILEKWSSLTNKNNINKGDGGLTDRFTMDEVLTNVMIYWVTNSITSSARLYKESMNHHTLTEIDIQGLPVSKNVPVGLAVPENDLIRFPRALLHGAYPNMVTYTDLMNVGHFPCFEDPKLLAADIKSFVKSIPRKDPRSRKQNNNN